MADVVISMQAAHDIWMAHREIIAGEKLLLDIRAALDRRDDATPLDSFGRRRPYQLGAPSGENSHKLMNVSPQLAVYVIEAHIAATRKELVEASLRARMELDGVMPPEGVAAEKSA